VIPLTDQPPDPQKAITSLCQLLNKQANILYRTSVAIHDGRTAMQDKIGTILYEQSGIAKTFDEILDAIHQPEGKKDHEYAPGDRVVIFGIFHYVPVAIGIIVEKSNTQYGQWIVDVIGGTQYVYSGEHLRPWQEWKKEDDR
jgi:hypothetical protein